MPPGGSNGAIEDLNGEAEYSPLTSSQLAANSNAVAPACHVLLRSEPGG
jgi:hypothetical protein